MNLLNRGDLDGLTSSVLLTQVLDVREIRFAHPKDCQDGLVKIEDQTIVVNLPYIKGCEMWFDHHVSEKGKVPEIGEFQGRFEVAPSCARVIYNHYAAEYGEKLKPFEEMLVETDRLDSAQLTKEDVTHPQGWILLGLTLDPRSGLGPEFQKYFRWLVEYVKEVPLEKVLQHPEVKKRSDRVQQEQEEFKALLAKQASQDGNVVVTEFRGIKDKPVGNRFLVFAQFPEANVEMRILDGHKGKVVVAVGHSIFNRTCPVNVGEMLAEYGGGGHKGAGTAQLDPDGAEERVQEILKRLKTA